ncbi:DUF397 domain-containing protein [Actinomadura meridiana]|uniref:DUF397 domain-containing protein n=1 Tax=Actinomadura meridiana TaxID=559626 RepID=A0ABP8CJ22_9ACTN
MLDEMNLSNVMWHKASQSTSNGGECVEVASLAEVVAIRDSKNPDGPRLTINHGDFRRVVEVLKGL